MAPKNRPPTTETAVSEPPISGEFDLIRRLAVLFGPAPPGVVRGIGDDCAVLEDGPRHYLLWTVDTLIEGVHFDLSYTSLHRLGRKALAVNLSDLAAMGGEPVAALLSLGWPPSRPLSEALDLAAGLQEAAREFGAPLIGGDTVKSPPGLNLSLTLLGRVPRRELLTRDGARPGDLVWVTGPLGEAAAGLEILRRPLVVPEAVRRPLVQAHLDPRPQLAVGRLLAVSRLATAAIDLSDGIASDLFHICRESGVGAVLEAAALPLTDALRQVAALLGRAPVDLALTGGEDYQLLFTTPPEAAAPLRARVAAAALPQPAVIGRLIPGDRVWLEEAGGLRDISGTGFDHFGGVTAGADQE